MEDIVSRTEFQYSLEDPNANELNAYAAKFTERLKELPELADVANDLQTNGKETRDLFIDRQTASRLGITPSTYRQYAL